MKFFISLMVVAFSFAFAPTGLASEATLLEIEQTEVVKKADTLNAINVISENSVDTLSYESNKTSNSTALVLFTNTLNRATGNADTTKQRYWYVSSCYNRLKGIRNKPPKLKS